MTDSKIKAILPKPSYSINNYHRLDFAVRVLKDAGLDTLPSLANPHHLPAAAGIGLIKGAVKAAIEKSAKEYDQTDGASCCHWTGFTCC
mmetsp:Transcript_47952/g.43018  ORF Transcript_47952/g.43018 Transcript_47952/m.43018 type:complete len:89 (-) Transcript_47952:31-297(-)